MRTRFSPTQLADPHLAEAEKSLRACMHCGICTATCPTYVLLGDERDGPRGRIVMMQRMLEEGSVSAETVLHVDRCLSCLACRTACPSSVDYARLLEAGRIHIERHYRRPLGDRLFRFFVAHVTTRPGHLRAGLAIARAMPWLRKFLPGRLAGMLAFGAKTAARRKPSSRTRSRGSNKRIALLRGCVQQEVSPEIDDALSRVLERSGISPLPLKARCCGAIAHHLGRETEAKALARRVISAFEDTEKRAGVTEVTISATGCAAHLKEYPFLFSGDPEWEPRARAFARKLRDVSELLPSTVKGAPERLRIAFHSACSAQNSLVLGDAPVELLREAGFEVVAIPEGHLCCGSAGSYSLLQPDIAARLRDRKLANIASLSADAVATGNIGCLLHLADPGAPPAVHYLELIDWAQGGAKPDALKAPAVEAKGQVL